MMQPVKHDGELFVIHPVARKRHLGGLCLGVLAKVSFPRLLEQGQDRVGAAESVKYGPVVDVFDRVIRAVVAAPGARRIRDNPGHQSNGRKTARRRGRWPGAIPVREVPNRAATSGVSSRTVAPTGSAPHAGIAQGVAMPRAHARTLSTTGSRSSPRYPPWLTMEIVATAELAELTSAV